MNNWCIAVAALLGLLLLLAIAELIRELNSFRTVHYELSLPQESFAEKRVVFLSDLHNHLYGKDNEKLLDAIRSEEPDLIFIAGDMLVGKAGVSWKTAAEFVKRLPEICPVYYGNGNHEQRMKEHPEKYASAYSEYEAVLERAGVCFLENASVSLMLGEQKVQLYGLEIPEKYYRKGRWLKMPTEVVENCLGKAKQDAYGILLAHNPAYCKTYAAWGADLILSGHLHGGLLRIPGIGALITPDFRLFPRHSGELKREGESWVVVSKGLGTHTIHFRLFDPAEVVVLHFRPCESTGKTI